MFHRKLLALMACIALIVGVLVVPVVSRAEGEDIKIVLNYFTITPKDANGKRVYPKVINGTTYLPVRALCDAVGKEVKWDEATRSVIIGKGDVTPEATGEINIYIDGVKLDPKDANGNPVKPVIIDSSTYLPVRAVTEALGMTVEWLEAKRTIRLTSKTATVADDLLAKAAKDIDTSKEYYIKVSGADYYLVPQNKGTQNSTNVVVAKLEENDAFVWTIKPTNEQGYYTITNKASGLNLNVSGVSTQPKGKVIIWTAGQDDNEKWAFIKNGDGTYSIFVKHSKLYLDGSSDGGVVQDTKSDSNYQKWELIAK